MIDKVFIVTLNKADACEVNVIQGALQYYGIPSMILQEPNPDISTTNSLVVALTTLEQKDKVFSFLGQKTGPVIFAGHQVTLEYLLANPHITEDEIMVYGEPFATIAKIARQPELIWEMKGNAVLGPLFDLREYRPTLAVSEGQQTSQLLTSLGCQKQCGYCTYGATYSQLYLGNPIWRPRPSEELDQELCELLERGARRIWLAANQPLSKNGDENKALLNLAQRWEGRKEPLLELSFDLSPQEALHNRALLEAMSRSFEIFPRLSVDSFDDGTLELLDLTHDVAAAMEAIEYLSHLQIAFRLTYILIRPEMTLRTLKQELIWMREVDAQTSYLPPQHKLLLAHDFLWNQLRLHPCMPVSRKLRTDKDYKEDIPVQCLQVISRMREQLGTEIESFTHQAAKSPLQSVLEAGMDEALVLG